MKKALAVIGIVLGVGLFGVGLFWFATKDDEHFVDNHAGAVWKPLDDDESAVQTDHNGVAQIGGNQGNNNHTGSQGGEPSNESKIDPENSYGGGSSGGNSGQSSSGGNSGGQKTTAYIPTFDWGNNNRESSTSNNYGTWETLPNGGGNGNENTSGNKATTTYARTGNYNGFEYSIDRYGSVTITGYTGSSKSISIPSKIEGYNVLFIGAEAFMDKGLTSITIPNTVVSINSMAFAGNCTDGSVSVSIPSSVSSIGDGAFAGINVTSAGTGYSIDCGCVYYGGRLISASGLQSAGYTSSNRTYIVRSGTTAIGYGAFYGCRQLQYIELPQSLTAIGKYAFYNCSSLKNTMTLPVGVTFIEAGTFKGCDSLSTVIFTYVTQAVIDSKEYIYNTSAFDSHTALLAADGTRIK